MSKFLHRWWGCRTVQMTACDCGAKMNTAWEAMPRAIKNPNVAAGFESQWLGHDQGVLQTCYAMQKGD
ncbi:hypothetical protein HYN46_14180 [Aquirhabdus parva]|uniref:Uncharacterized protein n=1 Tax=Aquirhabdus parva TaxID=2283318 RepID=A0A345P9C6_9GAMM|nr:hypothetical protein HYN46_14180 [Aquirhabdus parva]